MATWEDIRNYFAIKMDWGIGVHCPREFKIRDEVKSDMYGFPYWLKQFFMIARESLSDYKGGKSHLCSDVLFILS